MSLEADRRYDGVVIDAGLTQSDEKGTPALWWKIRTDAGVIDNVEWISPNTSKRIAENMAKCFGTTKEQLADMSWLEKIGDHLRGADVSIVTESEERRDGSFEIKVKWMNPRGVPKKAPTPATKSRVAQLFGGASPGPMPGRSAHDDGPPPFAPVDDGDCPF